jgi:hypothetical protein
MKIFKVIFVGLMILVTGLNGIFGGTGIAQLCLHGLDSIHFASENHHEKHAHCDDEPCGETSSINDIRVINSSDLSDCESTCTDIDLAGLDNEFSSSNSTNKIPVVLVHVIEPIYSILDVNKHIFAASSILPPLRAPPQVDNWAEVLIKKTVLII